MYSALMHVVLSFGNAPKERTKEKRWRLAKKCLSSHSLRGAEKTPRPDQDLCRDSSDSFPRLSRRSFEFRAAFFRRPFVSRRFEILQLATAEMTNSKPDEL
jgi:hypothetical protein